MVIKSNITKLIPILSLYYKEEDILSLLKDNEYAVITFLFLPNNELRVDFKAYNQYPNIDFSNGLTIVINKNEIIPDVNRLRLSNMDNKQLSEFIFGDELDYFITKNKDKSEQKFLSWLNEKYDKSYNHTIIDIHIEDSRVICTTGELNEDELRIGDILEIMNIDNSNDTYDLEVIDVINDDNRFCAKAVFKYEKAVSLHALTEIMYKPFRLKK